MNRGIMTVAHPPRSTGAIHLLEKEIDGRTVDQRCASGQAPP